MKKLFLFFLTLAFISCSLPTDDNSIPRSEWDKDNIAYINNDPSFVPLDNSDEAGTWRRTGFLRKSGTSGIVGLFRSVTIDSSNLYNSYAYFTEYEFFDNGYYTYKTESTSHKGKYILHKYNGKPNTDIVELVDEDTLFFNVSDKGIDLYSHYYDENNNLYYAWRVLRGEY